MIWPTEALLLARTKLKTRKVRLIITIVITSLLFSVLAFLASLTSGTIQSLKSFSSEGYGNKFFVQASPLVYQGNNGPPKDIDPAIMAQYNDLVARKKAEAKRLKIDYDPKNDQTLPLQTFQNGPGSLEYFVNGLSPIIQNAYEKKNQSIPGTSLADFTRIANAAGAANVYSGTQSGGGMGGYNGGDTGQVQVLQNGKEDLTQLTSHSSQAPSTTGVASITNIGWRSSDSELLLPFILPGQTLVTGKDGSVPVIAPYSAAEEILGLKALPQTATAEQKLTRLTMVRQGIAAKTAQLCYRNLASTNLLNQAAQQIKDIENNKSNKDYVKPGLLYNLPDAPCGPVTIKSDNRQYEEKQGAAHQQEFDQEFGNYQGPDQGIITIRIVGINPDFSYGPSISPASVLSSLFTSSVGIGWVSPAKAVEQNTLAGRVQGGTATTTASRTRVIYYAQFSTLPQLEKFVKAQTCETLLNVQGQTGLPQSIDTSSGDNTAKCIKQSKVYTVSPYGNSAGAVEQFRKAIWKVARYVILVIVFIAALIMMGNVGKIIADSRRETAVFRALGAKRFDIAQIYLTYTILISLLVALCSLALGTIASLILSDRLSPDLSLSAVLAYNAQDIHKQFVLSGFNLQYTLVIFGLTLTAGLLSALLPLLANTRRNPIRDMRDDT